MFHCEPERYISAFLTGAMFFDLLDGEKCRISYLPSKFPMAISKSEIESTGGAVAGARYVLDILGGIYGEEDLYLSSRQFYDFGKSSALKGFELAIKDTVIFVDWLLYKELLDPEKNIFDEDQNIELVRMDQIGAVVSNCLLLLNNKNNALIVEDN